MSVMLGQSTKVIDRPVSSSLSMQCAKGKRSMKPIMAYLFPSR